jgi:hypothetical protein
MEDYRGYPSRLNVDFPIQLVGRSQRGKSAQYRRAKSKAI